MPTPYGAGRQSVTHKGSSPEVLFVTDRGADIIAPSPHAVVFGQGLEALFEDGLALAAAQAGLALGQLERGLQQTDPDDEGSQAGGRMA